MRKTIDIIEALFFIYGAIWSFLYYTGRLKYAGDKEKRRKERVDKYGWILIIGIVLMAISGITLLFFTLILI